MLLDSIADSFTAETIAELVGISVQRSSDKVVSVRAKAISSLAAMLEEAAAEESKPLHVAVRQRVVPGIVQQFAQAEETAFLARKQDGPSSVVDMLQRRAADAKSAIVRKAALQALVALLPLAKASLGSQNGGASSEQTKALGMLVCRLLLTHCSDPSLLVRRQCLASLTQVAKDSEGEGGDTLTFEMKLWLKAALMMTADPEQTAQEQALDAIDELLFQPIAASAKRSGGSRPKQAWLALDATGEGELQRALQRACALLLARKRISGDFVRALQSGVASTKPPVANKGAWLLLAELAPAHGKHLNEQTFFAAWNSVKDSQDFVRTNEQIYVRLLRVVSAIALRLPSEDTRVLAGDIKAKLHSFAFPPSVIQGFVKALTALGGTTDADEWRELLRLCDGGLSEFVQSPPPQVLPEHEDGIALRLFTVGEVAIVSRKAISDRTVAVVEALSAPSLAASHGTRSVGLPPSIRAHALVALGKLCLDNEKLAKRCVAMFSRELQRGASPILRNNALVVMCDLCMRYTGMVDSHSGNMALCLVDASKLVRQQALLLLTRLLQENYLKLKGPLFFYTLRLLVDDDPVLSRQAQQCLASLVRGKESLMYFSHFVETVFHLNNFQGNPRYNQLRAFHPDVDPSALAFAASLAGNRPERRNKRMQLYAFMLSAMTPEHRLQVTLKLTQEVLAAVAEGELKLPAANDVIQDTLAILVSKEIKVGGSAAGSDDDDIDDSEKPSTSAAAAAAAAAGGNEGGSAAATAAAAAAAAKGALLTKIAKKNVVENVVPIAVELKRFFEREHSPLLRNLTLFFKALMQDHKKEMQDIFAANKQLGEEIEYDIRQLKTAPAVAAVAMSPAPAALPAKSPRPVATMFSPSTASPRADLARFSVPRLRPSMARIPSRLRVAELATPDGSAAAAAVPSKPTTPAAAAATATAERPSGIVDITLPSPFKPAAPERKWRVSVAVDDTSDAEDSGGDDDGTKEPPKRSGRCATRKEVDEKRKEEKKPTGKGTKRRTGKKGSASGAPLKRRK